MYKKRLKPYFLMGILYLILSLMLRIVFVFHPVTKSDFSVFEVLKILFVGILNDIVIFIVISSVFTIYTLFLSEAKYKKPWGYIQFGLLAAFWLYINFYHNNVFLQYGKAAVKVISWFLGIKSLIFGLMLFFPSVRPKIRSLLYFFTIFLILGALLLNTVSEYFFWNEFGVRYNFIAVDYLIYTNEVIGNIIESYPVIPLFSVIFLFSLIFSFFIYRKTKDNLDKLPGFTQKMKLLGIYIVLFFMSLWLIPKIENLQDDNNFAEEIQANGLYKFFYAFNHSELDFNKFYPKLAKKKAEQIYLSQFDPAEFPRKIISGKEEIHKNVVLISVESLSAEFLAMYGNQDGITPFLDSLSNHSLVFTNIYSTGNRTVRGLEALSMCIPPSPGESIIKRKDNKNKFTVGGVFSSKGYQVRFLYGGFSYFDNMKDFFEGNGYEITDRSDFSPEEINFANIWGVSDEDMAAKAIRVMNDEAKTGKPFFNHWMTVSNHRPFTYPEGRIDIPGTARSRNGGVKYTDYAIGLFFKLAKKQSWYNNTIFVIVADHCASSAGKTELPMDKYRIPALIYSPDGTVPAGQFSALCSQIDLMPTVLGLLNFSYESKFSGQDVFSTHFTKRAFIATYQDLGYIRDNYLTILSPVKKIEQSKLKLSSNPLNGSIPIFYDEYPAGQPVKRLSDEAIANYQTVYNFLKEGKFNK